MWGPIPSRLTISFRPPELLLPPIKSLLAHADLADRIRYTLTLRDQYIDLPQLRDDLFRLVPLPRHTGRP
jgi:hypothetical protein